MNPEQMRALADRGDESGAYEVTETTLVDEMSVALRAVAGQFEAVRGLLHTTDPGNPYIYDPWSDESVDPTNMDEVVHAAVSAGWSKGAYELAKSIREALEVGHS